MSKDRELNKQLDIRKDRLWYRLRIKGEDFMFEIDSKVDIPSIEYMKDRATELMERGVAIADLKEMYANVKAEQEDLAAQIKEAYGILNPNSSEQVLRHFKNRLAYELRSKYTSDVAETVLSNVLSGFRVQVDDMIDWSNEARANLIVEAMGHDIIEELFDGEKWTTAKLELSRLANKGYEDAIKILEYRKAKKYAETLKSLMGYAVVVPAEESETGKSRYMIHPRVSLGKSNRLNYSEPALMNIPKSILWDVVTPMKEGNVLVSVDMKNQEPWIVVNALGIEELKDAVNESGLGLYEVIFNSIFDRLPANDTERKELKQSWNALTYGATKRGIKDICRTIDADAVYKYFNTIPKLKEYKARCTRLAKMGVQLCKTYFNTELQADELGNKLARVLMDLPIQGTGADILALLIEHFDEYALEHGLKDDIQLYYTRHDEVILEVSKEFMERYGEENIFDILRDIFEYEIDNWEPFGVEIKRVGAGVGAGKKEDEE